MKNNQEPTRECEHKNIGKEITAPYNLVCNDCLEVLNQQELSPELSWDIKSSFEANFLDGDKINDCGGSTFTAIGALDVAEFFYEQGKEQAFNSGRASMVEEVVKKIEEMKVEELNSHWLYLVKPEQAFIKALDDILQALKNKENE